MGNANKIQKLNERTRRKKNACEALFGMAFDAENIGSSIIVCIYTCMDGLDRYGHDLMHTYFRLVRPFGRKNVRQTLLCCWGVHIVKSCFVRELREMSIDNSNSVNDYNVLVRVSKMKMVQSGKTDIYWLLCGSRVFDWIVIHVWCWFFCLFLFNLRRCTVVFKLDPKQLHKNLIQLTICGSFQDGSRIHNEKNIWQNLREIKLKLEEEKRHSL